MVPAGPADGGACLSLGGKMHPRGCGRDALAVGLGRRWPQDTTGLRDVLYIAGSPGSSACAAGFGLLQVLCEDCGRWATVGSGPGTSVVAHPAP